MEMAAFTFLIHQGTPSAICADLQGHPRIHLNSSSWVVTLRTTAASSVPRDISLFRRTLCQAHWLHHTLGKHLFVLAPYSNRSILRGHLPSHSTKSQVREFTMMQTVHRKALKSFTSSMLTMTSSSILHTIRVSMMLSSSFQRLRTDGARSGGSKKAGGGFSETLIPVQKHTSLLERRSAM